MHLLLSLALLSAPTFHPRPHKPRPVEEDETHKLWYLIEDHSEIAYPLFGLLVCSALVLAVRRGMKRNEHELAEKMANKDAIIRLTRARILMSAEECAGELRIDRFRAAALLEELVKEGKLVHQRSTGGIQNYRLKGF